MILVEVWLLVYFDDLFFVHGHICCFLHPLFVHIVLGIVCLNLFICYEVFLVIILFDYLFCFYLADVNPGGAFLSNHCLCFVIVHVYFLLKVVWYRLFDVRKLVLHLL